MAIIIEGHDATGKSTLALYLINILGIKRYRVIESEGPAKSIEEIHQRIAMYNTHGPNTIFVRHPCVSNPIYDVMRRMERRTVYPIQHDIIHDFYNGDHTFIYCDPGRDRQAHVPKLGEDPEHIAGVELNYERILRQYREWALRYAHAIYRIGDDERRILKLVMP